MSISGPTRKDKIEQLRPISGNRGASIIGPRSPSREAENRDVLVPPSTDHGTLGNLRWSFADSHMHLAPGGWGRQTTIRELPTSQQTAGVNMRLTAGGVREMHWHQAAEWAFMLKGRARITAIDQEGRAPFAITVAVVVTAAIALREDCVPEPAALAVAD
jgi:oxalate decarboxylase